MECFIGFVLVGSVIAVRRVWTVVKPRPHWKIEAEEWLHREYFDNSDAGERAVHDKMAKGVSAFNNPQGTWKDYDGRLRTDW